MSTRLVLGAFTFDPGTGALARDGVAVPLGGRALAVLTALAGAEGTVTKEALLAAAWPDVIVEEGNLTVQVAALRKLLGEDAIVTVPRVGYRLRREAAAVASLPRLAVQPFEIIGGTPDDGYFADGLAEDLITALGRFRQFAVLSRPAALAAKADLAGAGVRYRLDGSLRRSGDRLRIAAHLSDVAEGHQLWARSVDGAPQDIFAFQDRITEAVAAAVAPGIEAAEIAAATRARAGSVAAYDLYLRALPEIYSETEAGNRRAHALLARALEIEPDNGLFLGHAAWVLEKRATTSWPPLGPDDRTRAIDFARRALGASGGDPRVLVHAGMTLFMMGKEYEVGMAAVERALAENPNNVMAMLDAGVVRINAGDLADAEAVFLRLLDLTPGGPQPHVPMCGLAHIALIRGDYASAITFAARSYAANPNFDPSLWMLIAAHVHLGHAAEAAEAVARLRVLTPSATVASIRDGQPRKLPERIDPILDALRAAGLPEE